MAIAASVSVAAIAQAEDYQIEGGLSYTSFDYDIAGSDSSIGLDGRYHIETVSTSGVVLNEAAFVGRNSNVHVSYETQDKMDTDTVTIGVEWWFEDIYVSADNTSIDVGGVDGSNTYINLGYMVGEKTLAALIYVTGDIPEDGMGLRVKHVGEFGGKTVNLEAQYADVDGESEFVISGDYYFSDTLSAGLSVADGDVNLAAAALRADGTTTVSVKNFFTPKISGELDYAVTGDDSAITLRAAMRF